MLKTIADVVLCVAGALSGLVKTVSAGGTHLLMLSVRIGTRWGGCCCTVEDALQQLWVLEMQ